MSDTFYQIVGCIGFAAMIGTIIAGSRIVARIRYRATARALAPLARTARFQVTGLLGQGRRQLRIETPESSLGERLIAAGLIEALEAFCAPSASYAAAAYDRHSRVLTLADDVAPSTLPTAESFLRQAQLAVKVAQLNAAANT